MTALDEHISVGQPPDPADSCRADESLYLFSKWDSGLKDLCDLFQVHLKVYISKETHIGFLDFGLEHCFWT